MPSADSVLRFRADLDALTGGGNGPFGIAVSGGPDSLALLLLAHAALPGHVRAATVDHGLRRESAAEAAHVRRVCDDLGVPHRTLALDWPEPAGSNLQARAREARYFALAGWAEAEGVRWIATAHHLDDQAETVLMRLARGAGLSGLAAVRPVTPLTASVALVRPLLGWRKAELVALVGEAGIAAADDPGNRDDRFDRTRARALLAETPWLAPDRIAAAAANLADSDEALHWVAGNLWAERATRNGASIRLDARNLPREIQRRLLIAALGRFTDGADIPGPKLARLLDGLRAGRGGTLAGVRILPGEVWRLTVAPPRRASTGPRPAPGRSARPGNRPERERGR